ncbi:hypothetical protein Pmani_023282 [Petrolisthes manimaculis]|uniref:U-box domain-containing protein n=1 Tax=Petrolisthes manimaculis TaxID=1843537 RepID=A0AAE1PAC1_9EUCA|nr:hypothetical protein Pmani_023282 [Petrolisthes manimaculis]
MVTLDELEQRLYPSDGSDPTSDESCHVYHHSILQLRNNTNSTAQLLRAIDVGKQAIGILFKTCPESRTMHWARLAGYAASTVAKRSKYFCEPVSVHVIRDINCLLSHWEPSISTQNVTLDQSDCLKNWMLSVFCDARTCPDPSVRVLMLRFLAFYWHYVELDTKAALRIVSGVILNYEALDEETLLPTDRQGEPGLLYPLMFLLEGLGRHRYLDHMCQAAITQVRRLIPGPETRCLATMVQRARRSAERIKAMYMMFDVKAPYVLESLTGVVKLFEVLVTSQSMVHAYESPGLIKLASDSLVDMISTILEIGPILQLESATGYADLLGMVNKTLECLALRGDSPKSVWVKVLQDHSHVFPRFTRQTQAMGLSIHFLSAYAGAKEASWAEEMEEVPTKYLDSLTQDIMTEPVRLLTSGMTVDHSTIITLLLTSITPFDPFTRMPLCHGSFKRLPRLKRQIREWKNRKHCEMEEE